MEWEQEFPEASSTREQDDLMVTDHTDWLAAVVPSPMIPTGALVPVASGHSYFVQSVLDVRYDGLIDSKWIVSRKRTRNLGDFIFSWRKSLLKFVPDDDVLMEHVDEWQ